jgi:O-antigen/teichoic acid export membrane protein
MLKSFSEKLRTNIRKMLGIFQNKNLKSQIIRGGISSLIVNVVNKVLILITGILLVRILGKVQFGVYSYVLSLVFVLIIPSEYGISNLLIRETAKGITKDKPESVSGIWQWSLRITLFISIILLLISIIASILFSDHFNKLQLQSFYWGLALIPLHSLVHIISAALRGMGYTILGQVPDLIVIPGAFVLVILVIYFKIPYPFSSVSTIALRSIITFITLLFCIILFIKKAPPKIKKATPQRDNMFWLKSVLPLGLSSGLNMVRTRITIVFLGFYVTAGDISTFQVAISSAAIAGLVLQAINAIIAPQFASLYAKGEMKNLQKLVRYSSRLVLVFNFIATIIFIIWGKALLMFAFGADLVEAYPTTLYLLAGELINSLLGSVVFLLNMTGHEKDVMRIILMSSIINIILTIVLTSFFGINGAAISTTVSLILAQYLMYKLVHKKLGISSLAFGKASLG